MSDSRRSLLLWLGLVIAFSPVLLDLFQGLRTHPADRYTLLAPLYVGLLLWRDPGSRCQQRFVVGAAMLLVGLAAQSVGLATFSLSIARLGLPLGVLGVAWMTGRPALAVAALAFVAVPIPGFLVYLLSPQAESLLVSWAARALSVLGSELTVGGPLATYQGLRLELAAADLGSVNALALAATGWFHAVRRGLDGPDPLLRAALWAGAVLILQPVLVTLCLGTLPLGAPGVGRFVLAHGTWLALGAWAVASHLAGGTGGPGQASEEGAAAALR